MIDDPVCAKCGHPRSNHPFRHPFQDQNTYIKKLEVKCADLKNTIDHLNEEMGCALLVISAKQEELDYKMSVAKEALQFYASATVEYPDGSVTFQPGDDRGQRAAEAIKKLEGKNNDRNRTIKRS